ncbi:hypothetical protein Pelo_7679 [Pelomyxa schiedti]|nr:hypothetical protein Pelo_7679 [Pelomyxa schiedti]
MTDDLRTMALELESFMRNLDSQSLGAFLEAAKRLETFLQVKQRGGQDTMRLYVNDEIEYLTRQVNSRKALISKYENQVHEWQTQINKSVEEINSLLRAPHTGE